MHREVTRINVCEDGTETHESWITVSANRISHSPPGRFLFDSEIPHQHFVRVTVCRCSRKRDLNRDWISSRETLMEMDMSFAQWGAFVSSFGQGGGVPATLVHFSGPVPEAPHDPRLGESVREVREAGKTALEEIQEAYDDLEEAFERGAGKREMREKVNTLKWRIQNGPANMAHAAKSLNEHTENVVTKARADIEAMISMAAAENAGVLTEGSVPQIGPGE